MSTPAEMQAIGEVLDLRSSPIIFELGAYCGEDSEWMRERARDRHLLNVMVEADPRNCQIIRETRRGVKTVIVEAAIASYTGMIDFFQGEDQEAEGGRSGSGSIRLPLGHMVHFPQIKFDTQRPTRIPCWSLDHLMYSLGVGQIDLLWCDLQGAERDMILGGRVAISRTRHIFIEAEEVELYRGQALRAELLEMLPEFKVLAELDYNLLLERR